MNDLSEKQKRSAGLEYFPSNKQMHAERMHAKIQCHLFNQLAPNEFKQGMKLLKGLFGCCHNFWIEPHFYCDYGYNIHLGKNFYANHGVVILDAAPVTIGDDVLFAPGVLISTASHPKDPQKRKKGLETASPITIGDGVWIGMGAKILPGVNIGNNAIIGAGAVVTKDVTENTTVAGVPAVVIDNNNNNPTN
ncbi:sugar O-acetyltransferase [Aliiglaciecola sp. SL4]|uniref:sugar O-acetyltransferase n=1 Tax=Aliiglaciecola sp. SL4 TaxID=3239806 RepID=UPI00355AFF72